MFRKFWLFWLCIGLLAVSMTGGLFVGCDDSEDDDEENEIIPSGFTGTWYNVADYFGYTSGYDQMIVYTISANGDWTVTINGVAYSSGTSTWEVSGGHNYLTVTVVESMDEEDIGDQTELVVVYDSYRATLTETDEDGTYVTYMVRGGNGKGTVCGALYTEEYAPVINQNVTIIQTDTEYEFTATTDAYGFFYKGGLDAGNYTVDVDVDGYQAVSESAVLSANSYQMFDIQLQPDVTGEVYGFIYDAVSGGAIEGAMIVSDDNHTAYSQSTGYFTLYVNPGTRILTVSATGYVSNTATVQVVAGTPAATTIYLTQQASGTATVWGNVTLGVTGVGFPNVLVWDEFGHSTMANEHGYYSFTVSAGVNQISFTHTMGDTVVSDPITLAESQEYHLDVELTMNGDYSYGLVYGTVTNTYYVGIEDAMVSNQDGIYTYTDGDGYYTMFLPAGIHSVTASANGYNDDSESVSVGTHGAYSLYFNLDESVQTRGTVYGFVTDSQTGNAIEGAYIYSDTGESGYSNAQGYYAFLTATGTHDITVTATGYYNNTQETYIVQDSEVQVNFIMSPVLTGEGSLRFILGWGSSPYDLDSHLLTPEIEGSDYHVYYGFTGYADEAPYAMLDIDDMNGYGPETITVYQQFTGTYTYYVHNYSGTPDLAGCGARVQVYDESGLVTTVTVPSSGDGEYWRVCEVNGSTGAVTVINEIVDAEPTISRDIQNHAKF